MKINSGVKCANKFALCLLLLLMKNADGQLIQERSHSATNVTTASLIDFPVPFNSTASNITEHDKVSLNTFNATFPTTATPSSSSLSTSSLSSSLPPISLNSTYSDFSPNTTSFASHLL